MNDAVLLPANPTDADVCAAAEGIMQDTIACQVKARVPAPADLATAYNRLAFGTAGNHEYTFFEKADDNQVVLHLPALGYFNVSLD